MDKVVCISTTDALVYPEGGGHLWAYMNWALSFKAMGCEVYWLETVSEDKSLIWIKRQIKALKQRLEPYGLASQICVCTENGKEILGLETGESMPFEMASSADLLFNMKYTLRSSIVKKFRRSAFLDIDPGLLQLWMHRGYIEVSPHDVFLTIGENIGGVGSMVSDIGKKWIHTPPVIALDWWPVMSAPSGSALTTVTHWFADEWVEDDEGVYCNNKREGFLPFEKIPSLVSVPMELAICIGEEEDELLRLSKLGWNVQRSSDVTITPWEYQRYIQNSFGEFSCAKPSYVKLQNSWVSDRTICYLASGKPVVVQHTGDSVLLPDACGMFRFRTIEESIRAINVIYRDYPEQCAYARNLAEEVFSCYAVMPILFGRVFD